MGLRLLVSGDFCNASVLALDFVEEVVAVFVSAKEFCTVTTQITQEQKIYNQSAFYRLNHRNTRKKCNIHTYTLFRLVHTLFVDVPPRERER